MKQYSVTDIQNLLPFDQEFEVTRYNVVIGHYVPVKPTSPIQTKQKPMVRAAQKPSKAVTKPPLCPHGSMFGLCKKGCK